MRFSTLNDWLAWQETLHPAKIELGLDRVRAVLQRMGLAHPSFGVITVGGTNGKGSTVALLEACLRAAGHRVGAYTSPHLLRYNERVRIDRAEASDDALCEAFARVDAARGDISLTYFEFGTLAAFDIFTRAGIGIAVLEVGMGGRLDAVNVLDADVAVISTVDIDHAAWLGPDRETIGREKAGIFRAGRPAVYGDSDPPRSVIEHAATIGAPLHVYGRDFLAESTASNWTWHGPRGIHTGLPPPRLRGAYQYRNAAGALMALELLATRFPVDDSALRAGLAGMELAGRFQVLDDACLRICDVAHNPQAARALAEALRAHPCAGRTHAVFAMLADKDVEGVAHAMRDNVDRWHIAGLEGERAASAETLAARVRTEIDAEKLRVHPDLPAALRGAAAEAGAADRIVVFGSFHTVAAALAPGCLPLWVARGERGEGSAAPDESQR